MGQVASVGEDRDDKAIGELFLQLLTLSFSNNKRKTRVRQFIIAMYFLCRSTYLLLSHSPSFHPFCHLSVAEFLLASQVNFRSKYRQPAPVSSAHVCAPISCCIELRTMLRADGCPGRRPDALNNLLAVPSLTDWDMTPDSLHSCHRWSINSTTLSHVELLALARLGG
jgi:hypothetical protein